MRQKYQIKLETKNREGYLQAEEIVKSVAKAKGAGETSNLDLCYFLNDEGRARVKFDRYYIPMNSRVIELTSAVEPEIVNRIIGLLYDYTSQRTEILSNALID